MVPSVLSSTFDQVPAAQTEQSLCDLALLNSRNDILTNLLSCDQMYANVLHSECCMLSMFETYYDLKICGIFLSGY